jgi:hypothetical protein
MKLVGIDPNFKSGFDSYLYQFIPPLDNLYKLQSANIREGETGST